MMLIVVLISVPVGIFVLSLLERWPPDWHRMQFHEYVLLPLGVVVAGLLGLFAVGYFALAGLWPQWVFQ
jgi:hypothetical protein